MPSHKSCSDRYPAYKDSGVDWLGNIPEGWDLLANKFVFKLKKNLVGKKSSDFVLLSLTLKGIIQRVLEDGGKFPAEFDTYQEVKKGDFIFCLFDVEETPRCVGLSNFDGMITGAYTVMEVNPKFDKAFLYYFYLNLDADKRLRPLYTGLRNTISKDNFFAFKTFVPPLNEQTAIANFLDDKTAKIDRAIAQKEQLIALLKERKQIIIQNAVTGKWSMINGEWSMTPKEKMKDSGVEWIGEIPEGWEVKPVKSIFQLSNKAGKEGLPILSVSIHSAVSDNELDAEENIRGKIRIQSKEDYKLVQPGDIVYNMMRAWQGGIGAVRTLGLVSPAYVVVSPKQKIESQYFEYLMRNNLFINEMNKVSRGITDFRKRLYWDEFKNLCILIPNYVEQKAIVEAIETQSSKIDKAIELQIMQIEKLKEYKSVLVDAAVTGKIKVT